MIRNFDTQLGFTPGGENVVHDGPRMLEYANLKLAARGFPVYGDPDTSEILQAAQSLFASLQERHRLLASYLCPADQRIQNFLASYLAGCAKEPDERWLPSNFMVLERHGLARVLSLPPDRDEFRSPLLRSTRVKQGVCHNPQADRRTTKGVFHIVEGGFPVPADKREVPRPVFAELLRQALQPSPELLLLPFTSTQQEKAEVWLSLLLRPVVCPEVPGVVHEKSMETRFFAPASLAANLDFVESIFGNAGDPYLAENDAALDAEHWTGHTGCVILAPHLVRCRKKDLGLPHASKATPRQRKDGMCWESEDEFYNDGTAFKVTARDHRGVMVTVIADNYFGYCKKEVKTQLSYAANLYGMCEEEHGGGALAFPRQDLGEDFHLSEYVRIVDHTFGELRSRYGPLMEIQPSGYGIDRRYHDIYYIPEGAFFDLRRQKISWTDQGREQTLKLLAGITYVMPSGYKVEMAKPGEGQRWRLIGTNAEATFCHKPCTVSGGGKSEISKPISDSMISGPIFVSDLQKDLDWVAEIVHRSYAGRHRDPVDREYESRPLLGLERSLGSVVKLLTPGPQYTDEYNAWLAGIPTRIRDLVLLLKRFYRPHWGEDWRQRFSVDLINGGHGYELKYLKEKLATNYLRLGFAEDGSWRTFSLRADFMPAKKIQTEDDITASVVIPADRLQGLHPNLRQFAYKFAKNCEYRLFQRPDEAIVRGFDKTAEADFSKNGNFFSNYEPLTRPEAREMIEDAILFDQFSPPIQKVIREFAASERPDYFVCTSNPRLVDGKPSKNPRYLQTRPDLQDPRALYLADLGARLHRRLPLEAPVHFPVTSVLPGRRNNPPDKARGIRSLAVYNPIHYQDWPELFMELISSLTGKSPSTTGAGSEGALTKGPFNAMPAIIDLNNALVSYLLTGNTPYTTSAGYIGPRYRVDHDLSLAIPEVWSRMFIDEREPQYLIENGYLEPLEDFEYQGRRIQASRLGYRITDQFVIHFFGRIFSDPASLFEEEILRPEKQDLESFADGIENIVETQRRVAQAYFEDQTVELACPPLRALLHIMAFGKFEGKDEKHPEVRALFSREAMLASGWYRQRLETRRVVEERRLARQIGDLEAFLAKPHYESEARRLRIAERLAAVRRQLEELRAGRAADLMGTLGADPSVLAGWKQQSEDSAEDRLQPA